MKKWSSYVVCMLLAVVGPGCGNDEAASDGQAARSDAQSDGSLGDAPVPVSQGFGDYCTYVAHECTTGFFCVKEPAESTGFCSKSCPTRDEACTDVPAGTRAECLLPINNGFACQFVCSEGGSAPARCPAPLRCDKEQQVHGGVYRCMP